MSHKILLADDSITIQKVVNLTFSDEGINVVTVGNGELALKKLNEETFDLVLADIFMPGRNGYEVCEYVKTSPQTADVPVILLVGAFEPFDKSEAARVRADGHLTKPFESRILIETVKRMLAESAMRHAQQAASAPPPPPESGYKGQVVGWDVSTMPVPPQFEEEEPEPPPYDPYVSTAKLPPLAEALRGPQPLHEDEEYDDTDNRTLSLGAPLPTGALFSPAPAEAAPAVKSAPGTFDFADAEMPRTEADEDEAAHASVHAIEGPPDSVSGFSFNTGSGPLVEAAAPVEPEAEAERPAIGYQRLHATDSPLDLPDMDVVESHTHAPTVVRESRDPLLDTFADVAESTASVDSAPAPDLEANAVPEGAPSMTVAPTEGIISAWDPAAQPPASAEPEADVEPVEAEAPPSGNVWETSAYSIETAPPFGFAEESVPEAPSDAPFGFAETSEPAPSSPFELPSEDRAPSKPTVGLSEFTGLDTFRSSNATQRISVDEMRGLTSAPPAAPEPVEEAPVEEAPVEEAPVEEAIDAVPAGWQPEIQAEPVEAAASENGAGAQLTAIPQDLIDEVVRRTAERISDDVIREIVWEIVPDLAEQLIRKRLEGQ
jgi:CheY-like chemotaxis protein